METFGNIRGLGPLTEYPCSDPPRVPRQTSSLDLPPSRAMPTPLPEKYPVGGGTPSRTRSTPISDVRITSRRAPMRTVSSPMSKDLVPVMVFTLTTVNESGVEKLAGALLR